MRKSIAIDMDGVMADVESHFITWYHQETGVLIDKDRFLGVNESDAFPDTTAVRRFINTPDFFRTVPVIRDAIPAVKKLMEKYEVYIVSAAMEFPQSLFEKREWLVEHFPFISWKNIVFCGSKSIINTDYMIDDHIKNLDFFKGKTIMFTAGHNINHHHHKRANNWQDILDFFKNEPAQ